MCRKMFPLLILALALAMAVLVSVLPASRLTALYYISRFIEVMIPVLGAGALIKYLFAGHCKDKE